MDIWNDGPDRHMANTQLAKLLASAEERRVHDQHVADDHLHKLLNDAEERRVSDLNKAEERRVSDLNKAEERRVSDPNKAEERRVSDLKAANDSFLKLSEKPRLRKHRLEDGLNAFEQVRAQLNPLVPSFLIVY